MTNPRLFEQPFFVITMGMYFTIQPVTLEWSMLLYSIFVILNPENIWSSWKMPEG